VHIALVERHWNINGDYHHQSGVYDSYFFDVHYFSPIGKTHIVINIVVENLVPQQMCTLSRVPNVA
jgi:hypothetical protein